MNIWIIVRKIEFKDCCKLLFIRKGEQNDI